MFFSHYYRKAELNKKVILWPPFISKCPEYWELDIAKDKCVNKTGINGTIDTEVPVYDGTNKEELKTGDEYQTWDGITN